MQRLETRDINVSAGNPHALAVVAGTWVVAMIGILLWLFFDSDPSTPFQGSYYLLPWAVGAAVICLIPPVYLFYKGKFDIFHPLVFAVWIYILPCLVFGGVIIAFGWSSMYTYFFIDDPENSLIWSLIYVTVGYVGMVFGFALPIGKYLGQKVDRMLPNWYWSPEYTWMSGWLLIIAGTLVNIIGFLNGLLGFQKFEGVEIFDGLIFFLLIMFFEGFFLLWYALFRTPKKDASYLLTLLFLIMLIPLRMAIMGNRGSIFICLLPIAFAYIVSGQKVTVKHGFIFSGVLIVAVFIGMIYGTTFRSLKDSDTRMTASDYLGQVSITLDYISRKDFTLIMRDGWLSLADRLENLSSLAVVVSSYEKLAPYEKSYGLDNNILRDTYVSLIPRFIWTDKPLTSDSHAYSDLYFGYEGNSFAITPWGDLIRNFGPIGVPLGMMFLGIILRLIHVAVGEPREGGQWRSVSYYLLITTVSYESFYATLMPSLIRVTAVLIVTLYLSNLITRRTLLRT
jgi:hypothetical protein